MGYAFTMFALMLPFVGLYFLYQFVQRAKNHETLFVEEDYRLSEDGSLYAAQAFFDGQARQLRLKNETILFEEITGVYISGDTSRRISIGVLLNNGEEKLISQVKNNEMNRAARNAELIAQVVADKGAAFKQASQTHQWNRVLSGIPFEFNFT